MKFVIKIEDVEIMMLKDVENVENKDFHYKNWLIIETQLNFVNALVLFVVK